MDHLPRRSLRLSSNQRALLQVLLQKEGITDSPLPEISRRQDSASLPLSFAQQRLWFLDQWEPDTPVYTIARSFSLTGALNLAALERSVREVVRRHEVLRTTFPVVEGKAVQTISTALTESIFSVIDVAALPQHEREARTRQLAYAEAQRHFDLQQGPLLRVHLLRHTADKHILLLSIHHIVCDGWSLDILIREISTLYHAYAQSQPSPLPELPIQYADYTLWQRERLQGPVLASQLAYWKQHLQAAPSVLALPVDHIRSSEQQTFQGAHFTCELAQDLAQAVAALSQREDVTLFMTFLAAFAALLSRYSRQKDLVIGTPIANRTRTAIEELVGNFANTLALRFDLSDSPSFQDLLAQVREVCLAGYAHQDLPFEYLVEALEPERNLDHTPLFQVMFAFQSDQAQPLDLPGLTVSARPLGPPAAARMNLMLTIISTAEGLRLDFEYRTKLFAASSIAHMAAHLQQLLVSIVENPRQPSGGPDLPDPGRAATLA